MYLTILDKDNNVVYSEGYGNMDSLVKEGYTMVVSKEPSILVQEGNEHKIIEPIEQIN